MLRFLLFSRMVVIIGCEHGDESHDEETLCWSLGNWSWTFQAKRRYSRQIWIPNRMLTSHERDGRTITSSIDSAEIREWYCLRNEVNKATILHILCFHEPTVWRKSERRQDIRGEADFSYDWCHRYARIPCLHVHRDVCLHMPCMVGLPSLKMV